MTNVFNLFCHGLIQYLPAALFYSFAALLLLATITDLRHQSFSLFLLLLLLTLGALSAFYYSPLNLSATLLSTALFMIIIGITTYVTNLFIRQKGMGSGDWLLWLIIGFWIAPEDIPFFLVWIGLTAGCIGIFWKTYFLQQRFPFGSAITSVLFCHLKSINITYLGVFNTHASF